MNNENDNVTPFTSLSMLFASILQDEFKFQYVRGDVHIHVATQNIILTFLSKWHFAWQCKYGSLH